MEPSFKALPSRARRFVIGVAVATAAVGAWFGTHLSSAMATPPPATAPAEPDAPASSTAADGTTPAARSTTATIVFTTVPPTRATVRWGKTLLGRIAPRVPLVVVRPRDSGPLDVTVSAPGFLQVHTRAHTFSDSTIAVKLTRPEDKNTLFGYRAPLDAGVMDVDDDTLSAPPAGTEVQQPPQ